MVLTDLYRHLLELHLMPPKNIFFSGGRFSFLYDLNALGNHYIKNNIRILLVNNGEGIEFKNYLHPAFKFGDAANEYFAARGHFGAQSPRLVRDFVGALGFEYRASTDKKVFLRT